MDVGQRKMRIKKGDLVTVVAGSSKGNTGEVLSIDRKNMRIVVRGANMVTKHKKQTPNTEGGIIREEAGIHISNVMHVDPNDRKPTRVKYEFVGGRKVRVSSRTGAEIGQRV